MADPTTATEKEAAEMICPLRRDKCVAARCMLWAWSNARCGATGEAIGVCGLSRPDKYA